MAIPNKDYNQQHEDKNPSKIEKVTINEVTVRKPGLGKRVMETFFGGEDAKGVWDHVAFDVMIPAAKDLLVDAGGEALHRFFYGESRGGRRGSSRSSYANGYVSYERYGSSDKRDRPSMSRRSRAAHSFDELEFKTRVEAEEVLETLYAALERYDSVSVRDFYDAAGVSGDYTDLQWGWRDLRGAGISRTRHGYLIDLPRPIPLD